MEDQGFALAVGTGSLLLADDLITRSKEPSRRAKMQRVALKKRDLLLELMEVTSVALAEAELAPATMLRDLTASWDDGTRLTLLIDLAFSNPFSPYSLAYGARDLEAGLRMVAALTGLRTTRVKEITNARTDAVRAQRNKRMAHIGLVGISAAVALGVAGFVAAPLIGAAVGTAAGLSGAAATAHGLALLGGGTLASGGFGVAGGMWLVSGTGATLGLLGAGGSASMYELGVAQTRSELVKLQVTYKLVLLHEHADTAKAQHVIAQLEARERELRAVVEEEKTLNDENACRVGDLEEKLEAVADSIAWMREQETTSSG